MLAAVPDLDVLIVPIGGGGLISGIAVAAKTLKPAIEIIGVQAALYPSMYNLIKGQQLPMRGDTLAEGIAVKAPGRITSEIVRALVDDIVLVTEEQIEQALSLLINIGLCRRYSACTPAKLRTAGNDLLAVFLTRAHHPERRRPAPCDA